MSLERQKQILGTAGDLGKALPFLEAIAIIENIAKESPEIKKQYDIIKKESKERRERGDDEKQIKDDEDKKTKEVLDNFKKGLNDFVEQQINIIKHQYRVVSDGINQIPIDVRTTIANIIVPPAVTAPPGAANPLYALNVALTTKHALQSTLLIIVVAFTAVIEAANAIKYALPDFVLDTYQVIKDTFVIISAIPEP